MVPKRIFRSTRNPARTTNGKLIFRSEQDVVGWVAHRLITEESTDALLRWVRKAIELPWWLSWAKGTVISVLDRVLPAAILQWLADATGTAPGE